MSEASVVAPDAGIALDARQAKRLGLPGRLAARLATAWLALPAVLAVGALLRFWELNRFGLNSDEAVYAGQAASIAGQPELSEFFPTFRAHPLLFQSILSVGFHLGGYDLFGRMISAGIGLATVVLAYKLGALLYGRRAGLFAAAFLALMPYHVLVTRQVLLDGPMVFFATLALYLLARYAVTTHPAWLYAAGGAMGLTFLSKETGILLIGSIYAFFALSPEIRIRIRHVAVSLFVMAVVMAPFPLTMMIAGKSETGGEYLVWQLFRRPNHSLTFYPSVVPEAIGLLVVAAAVAGLWLLRREGSWRERLLLAWVAVPAIFFELWPVKGFQYLLPAAPAVAVLAARTFVRWPAEGSLGPPLLRLRRAWLAPAAAGLVFLSLFLSSWQRIRPSPDGTLLAGSGGMPAGREVGRWIDAYLPEGARFMTIGPSMTNIVRYYGHRQAFGLSVSPNPLSRNPAYDPIQNPDLEIRTNELQYLVWDSFSAARSPFFSAKLLRYADRYNGRVVHTESITVRTAKGEKAEKPLIVVYQVRPLIAAPPLG
ncbi:MAG TPA: glycosyltransferase family 39 protein [Gaiellaceae bacterium]|nr:glycosyltransferase family 39 protein [Gaiellaceae bacterium]